jgi:nucleoside-diphosphate-sugar epimerase
MTTLIVGCGYLGRRIAGKLLASGESVLGTTRNGAWAASLARIDVVPVVLDVLNLANVEIPPFDRLVYCVGYDRTAGIPMRAVYVDGLKAFLDALNRPVANIVYTSSTGVFGQDNGVWVDEDSATEPRHESGKVCLEAESVAREHGATIIRLAGLYGPGRIVRRVAILAGEPVVGSPDRYVNLIHIDDAATATIACLERGQPGRTYHAVDDRPVTRRELYELTAQCLGAPAPTFQIPEPGAASAREDSDRRISNHRLKSELGLQLTYPDVTVGIPAAIASE